MNGENFIYEAYTKIFLGRNEASRRHLKCFTIMETFEKATGVGWVEGLESQLPGMTIKSGLKVPLVGIFSMHRYEGTSRPTGLVLEGLINSLNNYYGTIRNSTI